MLLIIEDIEVPQPYHGFVTNNFRATWQLLLRSLEHAPVLPGGDFRGDPTGWQALLGIDPLVNIQRTKGEITIASGKTHYFDGHLKKSYVTNYQRVRLGIHGQRKRRKTSCVVGSPLGCWHLDFSSLTRAHSLGRSHTPSMYSPERQQISNGWLMIDHDNIHDSVSVSDYDNMNGSIKDH